MSAGQPSEGLPLKNKKKWPLLSETTPFQKECGRTKTIQLDHEYRTAILTYAVVYGFRLSCLIDIPFPQILQGDRIALIPVMNPHVFSSYFFCVNPVEQNISKNLG